MGSGASILLLGLVALPLLAALLLPALARLPPVRRAPWIPAAATAAICFGGFALLRLRAGTVAFSLPWIPTLHVDFALRLDGLAFLFVLLVTGIGLAIVVFSARYLPRDLEENRSHRRASTFYAYVLFFMGSMLGLVCADELLTLYVFWEATSVSSFLLIGLHLHQERSQAAAIQAFTITAGAGLLLFVAFLAIAAAVGTTSIAALALQGHRLAVHPLAPIAVLGVVVGAMAKSAQVPLHIWLPNAMVAPTPVSAYLHSATMVAGGVFLLARLAPLLAPVPHFSGALLALGTVSMVAGGLVAIRSFALKEILAWSTISQYGYIVMLLGLEAWGAATFTMGSHAVLKAGLFLVAGQVTWTTGESDLRKLGGLWRKQPLSTATAAVLAFGLAGLPLTIGFWMKELFYEAVTGERLPWLDVAAVASGVLTFGYMLRFFWRTFVSGAAPIVEERRPFALLAPPLVLAALVLLAGLLPDLAAALTDPAAASAGGGDVTTHFGIAWPPSPALWRSAITFALGGALFAWLEGRERQRAVLPEGPFPHPRRPALAPAELASTVLGEIGPRRLWSWMLPALDALGSFVAGAQTGKLVHYLLYLVAIPLASALVLLPGVVRWPALMSLEQVDQSSVAFATLAMAAVGLAFASAVVRSHIAAILMVGGVGFVLALIFALLRAPDVALVQVAVETVATLLLLLVLSRIRITIREEAMSPQGMRPSAGRMATVVAATSVGALVTAASLALQANPGSPALGRSFFALSASIDVDDVVTALLVDFRGLDTLGEITVFTAAVLGAVLLLTRTPAAPRRGGAGDA